MKKQLKVLIEIACKRGKIVATAYGQVAKAKGEQQTELDKTKQKEVSLQRGKGHR